MLEQRHDCSDDPAAPTAQFFLNIDAGREGRDTATRLRRVRAQRHVPGDGHVAHDRRQRRDVRRPGQRLDGRRHRHATTSTAGWGNDLSNADDVLDDQTARSTTTTDTHPIYEDRVYGGAGLDILIGNTGGDRLIDWVGECNTYLVPFAPFGIATVSRQVEPQLPEFLYALSASDGADPTRDTDTGAGDRPGPQRRAEGRAGPDHPAGSRATGSSRPAARPTRSRATSPAAGATSSAAPTSTTADAGTFAVDSGVVDGHRRRAPGRRRLAGQGRRRGLLRSTTTCRSTTRSRRSISTAEADRRLEGERLRHLRLLVAHRLQVRRHRRRHEQARDRPPDDVGLAAR